MHTEEWMALQAWICSLQNVGKKYMIKMNKVREKERRKPSDLCRIFWIQPLSRQKCGNLLDGSHFPGSSPRLSSLEPVYWCLWQKWAQSFWACVTKGGHLFLSNHHQRQRLPREAVKCLSIELQGRGADGDLKNKYIHTWIVMRWECYLAKMPRSSEFT